VTRSKLPFYKEHPEVAGISEKFSVNAASKNDVRSPLKIFQSLWRAIRDYKAAGVRSTDALGWATKASSLNC